MSSEDLEPILISAMRKHPTGEVRFIPERPIGMCGTSTEGFLRELDEWIESIKQGAKLQEET